MDWPHAPLHRFDEAGIYFVTGATHQKAHLFRDSTALDALQAHLFENAKKNDCWLQAWALLSNHYHLVVACDAGEHVKKMIQRFHTESAIDINRRDGARGRHVWFQYRDTRLTFEASWLPRLRYTHENAVHHGLARVATQYPWCSASWFERTARPAFAATVARMKIDRVSVYDDFEAAAPLPVESGGPCRRTPN
jgi:putative transposase